ncbi:hypothetical protein BDZ97DRAFT_1917766 [Flammula alnicola]|nr:hypothetical protein BDZ97DRAFT_1917766 [Flammula alnicola]
MPTIFTRDLDLDLTLESEARTTLILVGIGVSILVLATAIVFYGSPVFQTVCYKLGLPGRLSNPTDVKTSESSNAASNPSGTDIPISNSTMQLRCEQRPNNAHRMSAFFGPIRKRPSAPHHRNITVYRGASGLHIPPATTRGSPYLSGAQMTTTPSAPTGVVTPHIAGWMAVADSVVGRHPHAEPLSTRVATKAEIDMISGHVHIPWAYKSGHKPQHVRLKVQKPDVIYAPTPVQPGLLKDIGNIRGRDILVAESNTKIVKGSSKGKSVRRTRGKENMPAVLSTMATMACN